MDDWEYHIDDNTNTVYLNKYIGSNTDVKVYGVYQLNGKVYDTVLEGHSKGSWGTYYYPVFDEKTDITSVTFKNGVVSTTAAWLFRDCKNLSTIDLSKVKFKNIDNLTEMFSNCNALTSITFGDRSDFDNVTTLNKMFLNCKSIETIDFSNNFNPQNIKDMTCLFSGCNKLTSIKGLENLNTSHVTNMESIFNGCNVLEDISFVKNWDISQNQRLNSAFYNCYKLSDFSYIYNWNVENVYDMSNMFTGTSKLTHIDLSKWNTPSLKYCGSMFFGSGIKDIDLTSFTTDNVTDFGLMFYMCGNLKTVNLAGLNVSNITTFWAMFCHDGSIETIDITGWNAPKCINLNIMFYYNGSLKEIKGIDTLLERNEYLTTSLRMVFGGCGSLQKLDLSKWKLKTDDNCYYTFFGCDNLTLLDVSGIDTSNCNNMMRMFYSCEKLQEIKGIENWNVSNVKTFQEMFYGDVDLLELDLSKWNTQSVMDDSQLEGNGQGFKLMFANCTKVKLKLDGFVNPNGASCECMLGGTFGLGGTEIDMSKFDFANSSNITDILYSSNSTMYVNSNDYDILQAEIDRERKYAEEHGSKDIVYTILKIKDNN